MMRMSKKYTQLGTFVLDIHNHDRMIPISTVSTLVWGSISYLYLAYRKLSKPTIHHIYCKRCYIN